MKPKIISKRIKYKGFWAKIQETGLVFPNGKKGKWEDVVANDGVAIIALDGKKNIYLSKEWRSSWEKEITQLPVGMCEGNKNKEILMQAKNELAEEIGLGAKKWEKIITYLIGGRISSRMHIFLAQGLYESKKEPDEDEIIEIVKMPFKKACDVFLRGRKETTSQTIIGLALVKERLKL